MTKQYIYEIGCNIDVVDVYNIPIWWQNVSDYFKILVADFLPIYFLTFDLILGHDFNDDFSTE